MAVKEGYDVLRLIEHNQVCYVSSEYVEGKPLTRWIKYHPCIEKRRFLQLVDSITGQLSQIHRCRGNPCYRYVNPYSIIVSEDGKPSFLDINAKSNAGQLRIMKRRTVREHFLPPDEPYYQKESIELDIYGLGRTLQYLLSETDIEPPLGRSEEARFQKIISKCLGRHSKKIFHNVSDIQRMIPKYRQSKKKKTRGSYIKAAVTVLGVCTALGLTAGGGFMALNSITPLSEVKNTETRRGIEKERTDTKRAGIEAADAGKEKFTEEKHDSDKAQEEQLNMELGMVYFLKLKDYGKSREYFKKADDNMLAGDMAVIAGSLAGDGTEARKLREALSEAESEAEKQSNDEMGERADYYLCLLRGYVFLAEDEDLKNVLRLGEKCRYNADQERLAEITGYLALAHEGMGEYEEAVNMYNEQMKYEKSGKMREEIYKKTAYLLEQSGKNGRAQEVLRKGIEEINTSLELRTAYIGMMLKNPEIERTLCIQSIREQLKELPELAEHEEFLKLMREHGIKVEGE